MVWNVFSDFIHMVWKRNSVRICMKTSKKKLWRIMNEVIQYFLFFFPLIACQLFLLMHCLPSFYQPDQLYGIEKFWAFIKYYKHADKLTIEPRLNEHLSKFKTIEDFRVLEPEINEMLGVGKLRQSPDKRRHRSISESEGVALPISSSSRSDITGGRNESNYNRKRFVREI